MIEPGTLTGDSRYTLRDYWCFGRRGSASRRHGPKRSGSKTDHAEILHVEDKRIIGFSDRILFEGGRYCVL
jgi:hypothetical protein